MLLNNLLCISVQISPLGDVFTSSATHPLTCTGVYPCIREDDVIYAFSSFLLGLKISNFNARAELVSFSNEGLLFFGAYANVPF